MPTQPARLQQALLAVARQDKRDFSLAVRTVTEAAGRTLGVARCGIWQFCDGGRQLECIDLYDDGQPDHLNGERLLVDRYPIYFAELHSTRAIPVDDARHDPKTAELTDSYLRPHGITSMLDAPIWSGGQLYGVLCQEHVGPLRTWSAEEIAFCGNLADQVGAVIASSERAESERRWQETVDALSEAVFVFDATGGIVQINQAAHHFLDKLGAGRFPASTKHIPRDRWSELFEYQEEQDRPVSRDDSVIARLLRGETLRDHVMGVIFRPSGERRYYSISGTPSYRNGKLVGAVLISYDLTDQVHFERLKRDFLSTLAHELKTPLTVANATAEHVLSDEPCDPRLRSQLDRILRATHRMDRLIGDIVDLANITLGLLVLTRRDCDLAELAGDVVARAARAAEHHHFRLDVSAPAPIFADPLRLEQAVRQLLDNAVRYSAGESEIVVSVRSSGAQVILSVRDQGVGIPAHRQAGIFESFYRAHANTPLDRGGLGIGLFLSREIVNRHGGRIWFESEEGQGASFFISLPRRGPR